MANLDELRDLVARSCRILGKLDLTKEGQGHVSMRVPGTDTILIRARGPRERGVRFTTPHEVITCDLQGNKLEGPEGLIAPREVFIHTAVYRHQPEVNSVIHIHPPTVVVFTIVNKPLLPVVGAYDPSALRLWRQGIPVYPRSILISNDERGEDLMKSMGDKSVVLMRGHGITTAGPTVENATSTAIKLNELADMNYRASLIGTPEPISNEDIEAFDAMMSGAGRRPGDPVWDSTWGYYCELLGEA